MAEKPTPLTVDPVTDSFRRMLKAEPPRVGAATKNREVVAPFSEDGFEANSSTTLDTAPKPEQHVDERRVTKRGLDTPQARDWQKFNEALRKGRQMSIYWPRNPDES